MQLYARETLTINGKISTDQTSKVVIVAGESIEGQYEFDPNVEVRLFSLYLEQGPAVPPASDGFIASFCASNSYKAKESLPPVAKQEIYPNSSVKVDGNRTTIYPNPASDQATLLMDLPEATNVTAYLSDISGARLMEIESGKSFPKGRTQINFSTAHLAAGLYMVTVETLEGKQTKRLLIAR